MRSAGLAAAIGVIAGGWAASAALADVDVHRLPLGDGRVSDAPRPGYVFSCQQRFPPNAPGATANAPWIHGDTWDLSQKLAVEGLVPWPDATFSIRLVDDQRIVTRLLAGNGLPVGTATGTFPVARTDPAFQIDRNPNTIRRQDVLLTLPRDPVAAAAPACVPMGMIGIALNGVAIFNALDAGGRDAVAHEVQDVCGGHPEMRGQYHYHGPSACLSDQEGREVLVGYAIDGFGIYSMREATGRELTNADLDACHGRTSEVDWDGRRVAIYHYVVTHEYPYMVGCFRGAPRRGP